MPIDSSKMQRRTFLPSREQTAAPAPRRRSFKEKQGLKYEAEEKGAVGGDYPARRSRAGLAVAERDEVILPAF